MTLNMSNKLEEFYAQEFQQILENDRQNGKETIHSGQFMVSHFEAEEQDDDDSEIKMPDPDDPNLEKEVTDSSICTEVQRYVPQQYNEPGTSMIITTRLEIETNLSKLFKCMNLAYSQKLTSPKWNHFKGVRLRWKDKIRLNNVIWRCWHMQFIMKMKTPVCQFASPLDVDIHSNPQSVVLEGKYWKRQLSVIKAEYRKWRRNFKTKATGNLICDTRSEFDFLEWSPLPNDRNLMITEDWTSDTLFSAINVPFPFPDPREIARGAGIADFIQPSLGPLQPNLDDIDITTFQELLQTGISARLAPVPEEVNEDIFRTVEFNNFSALMGTEQMDSSNLIDVTNTAQAQEITNQIEDANMIELNTPLNSIEYADKIYSQNMDIQQEPNLIGGQNDLNAQIINSSGFGNQVIENTQSAVLLSQPKHNSVVGNNFTISNTTPINSPHSISEIPLLQSNNQIGNFPNKYILKGRVSKTSSRPFRREPHNYDKAQPTSHQTNIYQQMLAEQQKQQQNQTQILNQLPFSQQFSNTPIINSNNFPLQSATILNMPSNTGNNAAIKSYSIPQTLQTVKNQKLGSNQSEILSLLNMNNVGQFSPSVHQTNQSTSYKPYPSVQSFKKAASTAGYINISPRSVQNPSPANQTINFKLEQQQPTSNQTLSSKEMFRSNSLPLNSSLPRIEAKEETFAVPKYQAKTNRSRTRSNSMQQQSPTFQPTSQLQTATSEPMLHSTLAQLLTTNPSKLASKNSSSTNSITLPPLSLPPSGFNTSSSTSTSNNFQPQSISLPQPLSPLKMHSPPTNKILSLPSTPITNLSPDSFHDQDSPLSPTRVPSGSNLKFPRETQRRAGHIHAEQKRRYNIKNGFDMLHSLIPQLQQNPSAKMSKAAMLQKGAEYIKQLRTERNVISEKMDALRKERDNLNNSLAHLHSILPANGAPVSRQRTERVKQLYNQYVRYRTMENWKFWILGLILEPLINSYTTTVSMASIEELYRTALLWVDQHCSLVELRPAVSNKLRYISTTTDILSDPPSTLQEEVLKALNDTSGEHPNLNSS